MYKTEKRFAEIGEDILITDTHETLSFGDYKNGDVFTVDRFWKKGSGKVFVKDRSMAWINPAEYEVIVGEETEV